MKSYEVKVLMVREEGTIQPGTASPESAAAYWKAHVETNPWFQAEKEHMVVLLLDTRGQITGYNLVSIGTLNQTACSPREVFRAAVAGAAAQIVLMHNHPSGQTDPSEADVRTTQKMVRAGRTLEISVADHIIMGAKGAHLSMRAMGLADFTA